MNKIIIGIIAVLVIAGAGYFLFTRPNSANAPSAASPTSGTSATGQILATGNPDIIASNFLDGSVVTPTPVESNPSLTSSNSDITSGFDQAVNTSNL